MNELPVTYGIINDDSSDPTPPSIVLTNISLPNAVLNKADAIISFTATSADNSDIEIHWYLNDEQVETDVKSSESEFSYNFKELLLPSYVNKIRMAASTISGGSLICDWTIASRDTFITLENLERFKANLEGLFGKTEGIATLDINGKIPESQVTREAFNVEEYDTVSLFPAQGRHRVIYIDKSTNNFYRWDTATSRYVNASSPDSVKYIEQDLTEEQQTQARHNIGAISAEEVPSGESVLYVEQELTEEQQQQARTNIGAAGSGDVPANAVLYTEQELSEEQKAQARNNIDAVSAEGITGVVKYTPQEPSGEEKTVARTNIGAASQSSLETLTGVVDEINGKINNWGDFVREVHSAEGGIEVVYDQAETETIPTGLIFNGGYVDDNNELYLKQDDVVLPSDVFTPIKLPKGGGGGGSDIALTDVVRPKTARNGEDAIISFVATASDGEDLTVRWSVNGTLVATQIDSSGSTFSYNFKDVFEPSFDNKVKVEVESGSGSSISPRNWTVTTVAFAISWGSSIEPIMLNTLDANVYVPIIVSAESGSENIVTVKLGAHTIERQTRGSVTITVALNKEYFVSGANLITASMCSAEDPTDKAKDIYFTMIWGIGVTAPVVAFVDNTINCNQYDLLDIKYFVYDPNNEIASYTLQIGTESPRQYTAERRLQTYQYAPATYGTIPVALICGASYASMNIVAAKVEYNLDYYRDDSLLYVLDPVGHSNADADREQFAGLNFNPTGSGQTFDWVNGGFQTSTEGAPAFVVKKGNKVSIPHGLFEDADANGKTVDISFKVVNSDQYDTIAMQELNDDSTKGIILKANNGDLRLNNIVGKEFRYCENSRIDLSIHVENNVEERVITIWMDGVPASVFKYTEANMLVQNANKLLIGSEHCDVWLYGIRVYNSNLNKAQMIQNYVSNGNTTSEKVKRYQLNTILDNNERISIADLHKAIPDLTIVQISTPRITTSKKDPVPANITIMDGTEVLELAAASGPETGDGTVYKVQGTSSAAYGRSSYNLDLDFKGTGKKYKLSENAIPVNYINIKVNVASSENANNINAVDWYNTYQPYITEPRTRPGVRDTCEGKPCAVFFTNTSNEAKWFSSLYIQPNETVLYAMGDICNSKKNKEVFGQDGSGEHPTKCCIEVSGNDTEPERFRSTAAQFNPEADDGDGRWETQEWDETEQKYKTITHFEWRMKPSSANKAEVVQAWDNLVAWVVSTMDNQTKFKNEVSNYFAIDSLLYHFLFIEYFAGYDNVSKNTFYSYDWDATQEKYLWNIKCAYDMDTILAADNDGKPFGDYGLDYGDTVDGTPTGRQYFNAVTNTIWVNLKAAFQAELSRMYISLRANGAWNAQNIMRKWDTYQDKRPHAAMVLDAYNKYIAPYKTTDVVVGTETKSHDDSYLPRLQGSKIYWRKQFLTYQTSYMDGKYGYFDTTNTFNFRTNGASGRKAFTVKSYAKTYITFIVDSNKVGSKKVDAGQTVTFENISVGNNTTLYVTPDRLIQYVRPLNETQNSTFVAPGAEKLTEVILGGDRVNADWPSGTGLTIPSVLLKDLSIRNLVNFTDALNLSNNVELETLDTRNTNTGLITLPSFAPLINVQLNACTGISAANLNKVEGFTMENGSNLVSIKIENCNQVVSDAIAMYLLHAAASQSGAVRRIRATNINWTFSDVDALTKVATTWKGYNALGEEQDKPFVTGVIHTTVLSLKKLELINNVWGEGDVEDHLDEENQVWQYGDLAIYYESLIPFHTVTFWNFEKRERIKDKQGNDYVQYIDNNGEAYDPVLAGEIDTPTYVDSAGEYRYTFTGWQNILGPVTEDKDVTALYTSEIIKYTVRWYDKVGGTMYDIRENVEYGSEAVYDPDGTIGLPELHDEELAGYYKIFTGWDKSTGHITGDTDVYGTWDRARLPATGTKLKNMSIAQIMGISELDKASTYFSEEDYVDITVGHDFNFSNVESRVLISEPTFYNGSKMDRITDVKLFDENAPSFTLAIDYEYSKASANASIINCCDAEGGAEGFKVQYVLDNGSTTNNQGIRVNWGDTNLNVAHGLSRGMLVLRHKKGSKLLTVASSNPGRYIYPRSSGYENDESWSQQDTYRENYYAGYETDIFYADVGRTQATSTNGCLCFGAVPWQSSAEIGSYATGWIHWCKIWFDDLGEDNIRKLASWPHETWRMHYRGHGLYNRFDGSGGFDSASFIANAPLSLYYRFYNNTGASTAGGWKESLVRSFVNTRCFNALPVYWQALIKPVRIITKGGADNPTVLEYTSDKLYIPAYADLCPVDTGIIANEGTRISWMTNNKDRLKFMGITVPENARIITDTPEDPSLYDEIYHLKDGDVWIKSTNPSTVGYVYVSKTTAERHGLLAGRSVADTTNNIVAQGAIGGLWVRSNSYFTRTNPTSRDASGTTDEGWHFCIGNKGNAAKVWVSSSYQERGIVLMFSI